MFSVKTGQKFIIPAERDILISFAPVSNDDGSVETSPIGFIQVITRLIQVPKVEDKTGPDVINILGPDENDDTIVVINTTVVDNNDT